MPGVFVAGDVRAQSVKRVASAVGEGALAVTLVHRYLAERRRIDHGQTPTRASARTQLARAVLVRVAGRRAARLAGRARPLSRIVAAARRSTAKGEPATCFFVLLAGTISMHRRVEDTDVEISRTDQVGVYAGATQAFMPSVGDRSSTSTRSRRSPTATSG